MQAILTNVNWVAVVAGTIIAFALGSVWYSNSMFGPKWRAGLGTISVRRSLAPLLVAQLAATFVLAWALAVALMHSMALAILVSITVSALIKANGLFSGKSTYAIITETFFSLVQSAIIILVLSLIK